MKRALYSRFRCHNLKGWHQCRAHQQSVELAQLSEERETLSRLLESVKRNHAIYERRNRNGAAAV